MLDRQPIPHKVALIEEAHTILPFQSFADLGGCWGVNGGYAFKAQAISGDKFERAFVVDQHITPLTIQRAASHPHIQLVSTMLGSDEAREAVGAVDAIMMFDILLHQVAPDWDEFVRRWLPHTKMLIIYNQNWRKTGQTIRFVDRDLTWYKHNVYYTNEKNLERWYSEHGQYDPLQQKPRRDIHNFWQWGITSSDLIRLLYVNGFDLIRMKDYGPFTVAKPWIVNEGLIFVRSTFR